MRKVLFLTLVFVLLLALVACGVSAPIPNPPLVLGEKYITVLDYEQALLQFDQAIEIEPKNPRGYLGKYAALELADRHDEAVQTLGTAEKKVARANRGQIKAILSAAMVSAVDGLATATEAYKSLGFKDVALKLLNVCVTVYEGVDRFVRLRDALQDEISASQFVLCPDGEDEHGAVYHLAMDAEEVAAGASAAEAVPTSAEPTEAVMVTTTEATIATWLTLQQAKAIATEVAMRQRDFDTSMLVSHWEEMDEQPDGNKFTYYSRWLDPIEITLNVGDFYSFDVFGGNGNRVNILRVEKTTGAVYEYWNGTDEWILV